MGKFVNECKEDLIDRQMDSMAAIAPKLLC